MESDKNSRKHKARKTQEVSSFPAGDQKAVVHNKDKHEC